MAIYDWQMQTIKRSEGRSSVAAAAYRAGVRLEDKRTGLIHDFRKKKGIDFSAMIGWEGSRSDLWDAAEGAEIRKDSRVARELVVSIPHELSKAVREALMVEYCEALRSRWGVALDLNIHLPHGKNADKRNVHAHIQMTSRVVIRGEFGEKTRQLDLSTKSEKEIAWARKAWETHANAALRAGKFEARIDCRSLVDRGLIREPRQHLGPAQHAMEQRGIQTAAGDHNRAVDQVIVQQQVVARLDTETEAAKRREREVEDELLRLRDGSILQARQKLPMLEKAWAFGQPVKKVFNLDDFIDEDCSAAALNTARVKIEKYESMLGRFRQKHPIACWFADKGFLDHPLFFGATRSRYLAIQQRLCHYEGIKMHIEQEREEEEVKLAPVIQRKQLEEDERYAVATKVYVVAVNHLDDVGRLAARLTSEEQARANTPAVALEAVAMPPPVKQRSPGTGSAFKMKLQPPKWM